MFIAVSANKYELPLAYADTISELAKMLGREYEWARAMCKRGSISRDEIWGEHIKIIKVEEDEIRCSYRVPFKKGV